MIPGKDYIGVGIGALILNSEGKILMIKRGQDVRNEPDKWNIPGGKIDYGETLHEAVIRESKEECGIDIKVEELLSTFDHLLPEEHQHWVTSTYIATIISGTPQICEPEKCTEIDWFTLSEIEQMDITVSLKDIARYIRTHEEQYRDRIYF